MSSKLAGDEMNLSVLSRKNDMGDRETREITVTLTDQLDYYLSLGIPTSFKEDCENDEQCMEDYVKYLNENGIEQGNAFLGVSGISSGTSAVNGYKLSSTEDLNPLVRTIIFVFKPLELLGEPIGVTQDGGNLMQSVLDIDIVCLPTEIPDKIELNIEHLNIGESIHAGAVELPEGTEMVMPGDNVSITATLIAVSYIHLTLPTNREV